MISLRAYAKRRGVSAMAVSNAVKAGRLKDSVTRDENGAPKIADPDLADREWEANTQHEKRAQAEFHKEDPTAREGMTQSEASAVEKVWKAKLAEQEYRERAKELVEVAEVEAQISETFSEVRTKLLGIPTRLRQAAPHVAPPDVVLVENLIREALEAISQ